MNILVSACLLGIPCRYDGRNVPCQALLDASKAHHIVPFCPEVYGGLATPRDPAQRQGERVVTESGADVTAQYRLGAEEAVRVARLTQCRYAILKEKSPSCGSGRIYDGTFSGTLTEGDGLAAQRLKEDGVVVMGESEAASFFAALSAEEET